MVKKEKKLSAVLTLRTRIRVSPPGSYPALPSKAKVSTGLLDSGPGSGPSGSVHEAHGGERASNRCPGSASVVYSFRDLEVAFSDL